MLLKRDAILAVNDSAVQDVDIPEWGGTVRVRSMTVAERSEFATRLNNAEEKTSIGSWLVATLAIDEAGAALFQPADVAVLEKKNPKAIDRLVNAITAVNKVDEARVDAAEKT